MGIRESIFDRLTGRGRPRNGSTAAWLHQVLAGSFYKVGNMVKSSDLATIDTIIKAMRVLAQDSQISTALSYYATDATTPNTEGKIIWAVPADDKSKEVAEIVNTKFDEWDVNAYARDHILELATVGNLYIPTTDLYKERVGESRKTQIALDNNTIPGDHFDIVPAMKLQPENVVHLYEDGSPFGYILEPDEGEVDEYTVLPESSIVHFALGGLLGDYSVNLDDNDGDTRTFNIKFAQPLMEKALQPTQTLNLLENALLLASLSRVVRFIALDVGNVNENEAASALMELKSIIEQQMSLNTSTGDMESYLNPQSPNNLIYLPKIDGNNPIDIVSLDMTDITDADNKLLDYYQDKKLSVLGVPKEAMNFSSNEGLGGAGSVLSQRSALYANALARLTTAYKSGWRQALNSYFERRGMSGFVDQYTLHMHPIITAMSDVESEKRNSAVSQAQQLIDMLKSLGIEKGDVYRQALVDALTESFPMLSAELTGILDGIKIEGDDDGM